MKRNQTYKKSQMICRYWPQTNLNFKFLPLCQQHLDLTIFITYRKRTHQPATTAQLKALATHYQGEVSIGVNGSNYQNDLARMSGVRVILLPNL